jgi:hypothetical protein
MATLFFLGIVAFVVWAWVQAMGRTLPVEAGGPSPRRWWLIALAWLVVSALPTLSGVLRPGGPVPAQAVMLGVLAIAAWFSFSRFGGRIASAVPLYVLVGFQGFRLPLELVLHEWVATGIAPPQMTWTGQNVDIVAGGLALVSIPFVRWRPRLAWAPSIVGALLLANVLRIVALSLPGPFQSFPDTITLPYSFPHVWIATVCVAGAVVGHLIAFRALVRGQAVA